MWAQTHTHTHRVTEFFSLVNNQKLRSLNTDHDYFISSPCSLSPNWRLLSSLSNVLFAPSNKNFKKAKIYLWGSIKQSPSGSERKRNQWKWSCPRRDERIRWESPHSWSQQSCTSWMLWDFKKPDFRLVIKVTKKSQIKSLSLRGAEKCSNVFFC